MTGIGHAVLSVDLYTTGRLPGAPQGSVWHIDYGSIEYLYLIEDLYSFCMTGKIQFYDRIGISEFGPLNGSEKLAITFGNDNGEGDYKKIVMNILKIEKIERAKGSRPSKDSLVELVLVDEYYQKWHSHFWSKSWVNANIGDIIKDIAKNHLGIEDFVQFERPRETIEYFDTHNRTPAECISWLMNRASGSQTKQPGYLLYNGNNNETDRFGYSFVTLEKLLSNKKWMPPYDINDVATYVFESDNPNYVNKIENHKIVNVDLNALKSLSGGTVLGYDIRRKKLIKQVYTYQDAVDRFTILGRKTLFPVELNITHPMIRVDGYSNEDILDNLWFGNWIREYTNQQQVHLTVNGHTKRKVGGLIRVIWPSHDDQADGVKSYEREAFNRQWDGKYIIKSITHYFQRNSTYGWQQKLVCVKNGYTDSFNPSLVNATKKNV